MEDESTCWGTQWRVTRWGSCSACKPPPKVNTSRVFPGFYGNGQVKSCERTESRVLHLSVNMQAEHRQDKHVYAYGLKHLLLYSGYRLFMKSLHKFNPRPSSLNSYSAKDVTTVGPWYCDMWTSCPVPFPCNPILFSVCTSTFSRFWKRIQWHVELMQLDVEEPT
jgi:hypothetical protein